MLRCEHIEVVYEKREVIARPYRWSIHWFRCAVCDVKASVVERERIPARTRRRAPER
jgi:hypothetical protein